MKATLNVTPAAPTAPVTVDDERKELGREANYELISLAHLLQKEIIERDTHGEIVYIARGILARIKMLSDIVYDAVFCDEDQRAELNELRSKMNGVGA